MKLMTLVAGAVLVALVGCNSAQIGKLVPAENAGDGMIGGVLSDETAAGGLDKIGLPGGSWLRQQGDNAKLLSAIPANARAKVGWRLKSTGQWINPDDLEQVVWIPPTASAAPLRPPNYGTRLPVDVVYDSAPPVSMPTNVAAPVAGELVERPASNLPGPTTATVTQ